VPVRAIIPHPMETGMKKASPSGQEIVTAMADTLCRCGTFPAVRAAIRAAAKMGRGRAEP
jgi:aerobic-type carbon monoxide dehydrogenase small subunit (CoxS/CutS family)